MTDYNTKLGGRIKAINATIEGKKKIQAGVESENYVYGQIPESDYLTCIDKKNDVAYALLRGGSGTNQEIECSCDYFKDNHMICEHLFALKDVDVSKLDASPNWLVEFLQVDNDWHIDDNNRLVPPSMGSEKVVPEVVASVPPINEEPPKKEKRTCPHCNLTMPESRYEKHLSVCKKNPAKQKSQGSPTVEPPPREKPKPPEEPTKREPTKSTAVSTDVRKMPSDAEFRDAKTGRILQAQGGFYRVAGGKEVPDAMSVQAYAVGKAGISTEVIKVEQDADHALAIVRCHKGELYTDASVFIDFATQRRRELLKVANKNPKAVRGWDENGPIFDNGFMVVTGKKSTPLVVYLFNRMTDFAYFAPRTAESQAARRAQSKMLGTEWRDNEEISTEAEEVSSVNQR